MPIDILSGIVMCIVGIWLGSIEVRFRSMAEKLTKTISRDEAGNLIDLKQMPMKVLQQELKEDIKEIKSHIEQIRNVVCKIN